MYFTTAVDLMPGDGLRSCNAIYNRLDSSFSILFEVNVCTNGAILIQLIYSKQRELNITCILNVVVNIQHIRNKIQTEGNKKTAFVRGLEAMFL